MVHGITRQKITRAQANASASLSTKGDWESSCSPRLWFEATDQQIFIVGSIRNSNQERGACVCTRTLWCNGKAHRSL